MTQISSKIPNLIGGIEQRPKDIRALNTAALLNNVWLSPAFGMITRPCTEYVGTFGVDKGADDFVALHGISKPTGDYMLGYMNGALYVMDLSDGTLDTVVPQDTIAYTYENFTSLDEASSVTDGSSVQVTVGTEINYTVDGIKGESGVSGGATVVIEKSATGAFAGEETIVATHIDAGGNGTYTETISTNDYVRGTITVWGPSPGGNGGDISVVFNDLATLDATYDPYDYVQSGSDAQNLGFLTVGDTTFIYNKTVTVTATTTTESGVNGITESGTSRRNPNLHFTWWVKAASYPGRYSLYKNNGKIASQGYGSGSSSDTSDIADDLQALISTPSEVDSKYSVTDTIKGGRFANESDWIKEDSTEGNMTSYNDYVDEFADLCREDKTGRLVLVKQDAGEANDDYWVWFKGGAWEETYGWNSYEQLDAQTMPHILVDNLDGTWTLSQQTWAGRESGDTDSNPTPSFVGNTIKYMRLHKGRMMLLADENAVFSEVNNFENFYRTTNTQLIDDDPIDIASSESTGGELHFGIEFNREMLLSSSVDQFSVAGDAEGLLSPNTAVIRKTNSYNVSNAVTPISIGPNIMFVDDFGNKPYGQVLEYQVERVFGREVALPITDAVPEFIPTGIYTIYQSSTDKIAHVLSEGDRTATFNYHYYFGNDGKIQAAWTKWIFDGEIYGGTYLEDIHYVIMRYDSKMHVHKLIFNEGLDLSFNDSSILLDYKLYSADLTVAMNGANTEVTLPYAASTDMRLVVSPQDTAGAANPGDTLVPDSAATTVLTFNDIDLTGTDFCVGFPYTFTWTMNPFYIRDKNNAPIQDGRLQLSYVTILFNNSNNFTATVTPAQRTAIDTSLSTNSGLRVGRPTSTVGNLEFFDGEFRFPAYGNADKTEITVTAETPWRVGFTTVEFYGNFRPKRKV